MKRRDRLARKGRLIVFILGLSAVLSQGTAAQNATKTVTLPMVKGPITGPGPTYPALTQNSLTGQQGVLPKGTDLSDFD